VGRLKYAAVNKLMAEIDGDLGRILSVETAQVVLTETQDEQKKYNDGNDMHYYVIPRILYKKL